MRRNNSESRLSGNLHNILVVIDNNNEALNLETHANNMRKKVEGLKGEIKDTSKKCDIESMAVKIIEQLVRKLN